MTLPKFEVTVRSPLPSRPQSVCCLRLAGQGGLRLVSHIYDGSIDPTRKSEPYRCFDADCRDILHEGLSLFRGMDDAYYRALDEATIGRGLHAIGCGYGRRRAIGGRPLAGNRP